MPDEVILVIKVKVPRADADELKDTLKDAVQDFFVEDNKDVEIHGEIETEEIPK